MTTGRPAGAEITPEQWARVKELFAAAREFPRELPPAERAARLHELAAGDARLEAEVASLLAEDARGGTLGTPAGAGVPLSATRLAALLAAPGATPLDRTRIGPFRLLRVLGEGGMGRVYLAEQEAPRRHVALKVIRPAWLSPAAIRRFEQETAVLARLKHPGIAQIYAAGTESDALGPVPWFALEYVEGETLVDHARARGLDAAGRIVLVAKVADAVEHAHQKGVIHRDLKPGNILVDASGQPKVLDFGIARATDADLQATTIRTAAHELVGTLAYMSPEQAAGDPAELDTRSDIYALGAVLFELLSGVLPHELDAKSIPEAIRAVAEAEPRRLSAVVPALRGDLETVVAKALAREKPRRYASASQFADDLRRVLRHEPVSARPTSATYQLRKFARRNRLFVAALAGAFLILVGGAGATAWKAFEAVRERDRATFLKGVADHEAGTALAIVDFLLRMLAAADPTEQGKDARVIDFLDATVKRIDTEFPGSRQVEADVRLAIGNCYRSLGALDLAETQMRRAVALHEAESGPDDKHTLDALTGLGIVLVKLARLDEAAPLLERVERTTLAEPDARPQDVLNTLTNIAALHFERDDFEVALVKLRKADAYARAHLPARSPERVRFMASFGATLQERGELDEAVAVLTEGIALSRQVFGDGHPDEALLRNNLAQALKERGDDEGAERELRAALVLYRKLYGDGNADLAACVSNLGLALMDRRGPSTESEALLREGLALREKLLPAGHPDIDRSWRLLGVHLHRQQNFAEAGPLLAKSFAWRRARPGLADDETLGTGRVAAGCLIAADRAADAEPIFVEIVAAREAAAEHAEDDVKVACARVDLGDCQRRLGADDEARPLLEAAAEVLLRRPAAARSVLDQALRELAAIARARGDAAEEARWNAELAQLRRR